MQLTIEGPSMMMVEQLKKKIENAGINTDLNLNDINDNGSSNRFTDARDKYDNAHSTNDFLTPSERAFNIRKCLEGTQNIINLCFKNYEETKDLNALKVAFDCYCSLSVMLKQVQIRIDQISK